MTTIAIRARNWASRPESWAAALVMAMLLLPFTAQAQAVGGGSDVGGMLGNVVSYLQGSVLTSLAALAVIIVGITMMMLRFSLFSIGMVIGGIAIAFSASSIVSMIRGG